MNPHRTIGDLLDEASIAGTAPYRCMYCAAESDRSWLHVEHADGCVYAKAKREWNRYRNYLRLRNMFAMRE